MFVDEAEITETLSRKRRKWPVVWKLWTTAVSTGQWRVHCWTARTGLSARWVPSVQNHATSVSCSRVQFEQLSVPAEAGSADENSEADWQLLRWCNQLGKVYTRFQFVRAFLPYPVVTRWLAGCHCARRRVEVFGYFRRSRLLSWIHFNKVGLR